MEDEVKRLGEEVLRLMDENEKLRGEIEQLKKDKYIMKLQNDINMADNNHLEKILRDIKETISYL